MVKHQMNKPQKGKSENEFIFTQYIIYFLFQIDKILTRE